MNFEYNKNRQFESIFSHLRKSQKEKKQQNEMIARKNKIKKNRKSSKRKMQKTEESSIIDKLEVQENSNNILEYLRCDQDINQDHQQIEYRKRQQFEETQKQMLQDFISDLVQQICYQNNRRKSLLQIEPKGFLDILVKIEKQFAFFIDKIIFLQNSFNIDFRQKKLNESYLENLFIQQILLNIPEIKEVLQNFEDKYSSNEEYKNQYRQLLTKKKIIYGIKKIIDKQNESDQDNYCCSLQHFQLSDKNQQWSHTQQIFSILNYNRSIRESTREYMMPYDWQEMKIRLNQFSLKIQEEMNSKNKKKKKRKQQKKKKIEEHSQQQQVQFQQNKKVEELCEYFQKMEIDHSKRTQCRLQQQWIDNFRHKRIKQLTSSKKNNTSFKFSIKSNFISL